MPKPDQHIERQEGYLFPTVLDELQDDIVRYGRFTLKTQPGEIDGRNSWRIPDAMSWGFISYQEIRELLMPQTIHPADT